MKEENTLNIVGIQCREFRENTLHETLTEFAARHEITKQNIHNFEAGRTLSGKILYMYVKDGFSL